MGCDETMKLLPLIDFSNLKKETPTWESVKTQVREALEECGCFEARFDEISLHLQKSLIHAIQQLFDLPLQTKLRNTYDNNKHYQGYIGQHPLVPLYESLGIQDALSPGKIDTFANLLWPQGNPTFRSYQFTISKIINLGPSFLIFFILIYMKKKIRKFII